MFELVDPRELDRLRMAWRIDLPILAEMLPDFLWYRASDGTSWSSAPPTSSHDMTLPRRDDLVPSVSDPIVDG